MFWRPFRISLLLGVLETQGQCGDCDEAMLDDRL